MSYSLNFYFELVDTRSCLYACMNENWEKILGMEGRVMWRAESNEREAEQTYVESLASRERWWEDETII